MWKHISNPLRHFSTQNSHHVTHRVWKKGFIKGEALRLLRTNSSRFNFEENITKFKSNLIARGYPERLIHETLSEVKFENRNAALTQEPKVNKRILPFVTQYQPSVPNLRQILMKNWYLIEQQPLLKEIFKEPPIISYTRGRSLKDILVRAKLWARLIHVVGVVQACQPHFCAIEVSKSTKRHADNSGNQTDLWPLAITRCNSSIFSL